MTLGATEYWKERLTVPTYRVGAAAMYSGISASTVAAWHKRTLSPRESGSGLSFLQLIEVSVVAKMRKSGIKLAEIVRARDYFGATTGLDYPFAQVKFKTDGADILGELDDIDLAKSQLLAANHSGQYIWREMLTERLQEFNYDELGSVQLWNVAGIDKEIKIDPRIAFGEPQILGVRTGILKSRWIAGHEVSDLADDFSISESLVVEGLLFEGIDRDHPRLSVWIN